MEEQPVVDPNRSHTIVNAEITRGYEVKVIIDRSQQKKGFGPWSMIIDESPNSPPSMGIGPSPVDTAFAALAA